MAHEGEHVQDRFGRRFGADVIEPLADFKRLKQEWPRRFSELLSTVIAALLTLLLHSHGGRRSGSQLVERALVAEVRPPNQS